MIRWWHSLSAGILGGLIFYKLSNDIYASLVSALMIFGTTAYGFVINNIVDRFKDSMRGAKNVDLVANKEKLLSAKFLAVLLLLLSVISSLFLQKQGIIINTIVLLILTIYSYINNKYGIIANILTCLCVSLIFWISPINNSNLIHVAFLSSFAFLYMISREFIVDDYDKEDDLKVQKTSLSIIFGSYAVKRTSLFILTIGMLVFSVIIFNYQLPYAFFIPVIIGNSLGIWGIIKYFNHKSDSTYKFFYKVTSLGYLTTLFAIFYL
ncbi:MAG: UbiA family prenyltransferase [Bacteroidales bacterium]